MDYVRYKRGHDHDILFPMFDIDQSKGVVTSSVSKRRRTQTNLYIQESNKKEAGKESNYKHYLTSKGWKTEGKSWISPQLKMKFGPVPAVQFASFVEQHEGDEADAWQDYEDH